MVDERQCSYRLIGWHHMTGIKYNSVYEIICLFGVSDEMSKKNGFDEIGIQIKW